MTANQGGVSSLSATAGTSRGSNLLTAAAQRRRVQRINQQQRELSSPPAPNRHTSFSASTKTPDTPNSNGFDSHKTAPAAISQPTTTVEIHTAQSFTSDRGVRRQNHHVQEEVVIYASPSELTSPDLSASQNSKRLNTPKINGNAPPILQNSSSTDAGSVISATSSNLKASKFTSIYLAALDSASSKLKSPEEPLHSHAASDDCNQFPHQQLKIEKAIQQSSQSYSQSRNNLQHDQIQAQTRPLQVATTNSANYGRPPQYRSHNEVNPLEQPFVVKSRNLRAFRNFSVPQSPQIEEAFEPFASDSVTQDLSFATPLNPNFDSASEHEQPHLIDVDVRSSSGQTGLDNQYFYYDQEAYSGHINLPQHKTQSGYAIEHTPNSQLSIKERISMFESTQSTEKTLDTRITAHVVSSSNLKPGILSRQKRIGNSRGIEEEKLQATKSPFSTHIHDRHQGDQLQPFGESDRTHRPKSEAETIPMAPELSNIPPSTVADKAARAALDFSQSGAYLDLFESQKKTKKSNGWLSQKASFMNDQFNHQSSPIELEVYVANHNATRASRSASPLTSLQTAVSESRIPGRGLVSNSPFRNNQVHVVPPSPKKEQDVDSSLLNYLKEMKEQIRREVAQEFDQKLKKLESDIRQEYQDTFTAYEQHMEQQLGDMYEYMMNNVTEEILAMHGEVNRINYLAENKNEIYHNNEMNNTSSHAINGSYM